MPLLYQLIQVILNKKKFNLLHCTFLFGTSSKLPNIDHLVNLQAQPFSLQLHSHFSLKSDLDILAKLIPFSEILWKHIHIFYIYTTHKRLQNWWRHHHYLNVEVSWNTTFQFCFFSCSENDAVKKIVLIIVYGKAFYHPYFYHRYKSLIYLVRLKLWYGYGYWLHIILLFAWMLFFDTCPCLDCCLVLDLACITSTLNITLTFSVAGLILGILYFWGLLLQLFFETCLHSRSFNWLWN